ncbi:hypothetical protein DWY65_13200 [Bacteroides stercoris]|uniref:Uncharacterized protein n=1 Tax=Bacteroides stercoris TaxID=46506 RepID=A0A412DFP2_BACSE|nr:hypothetical protein DWY65_13200 [Bacteroides stercoris]
MSKLTFACNLFLFRHGLHGKHRFSLFFSVKSTKSVPKRNHQMYFDTLSYIYHRFTFLLPPHTPVYLPAGNSIPCK